MGLTVTEKDHFKDRLNERVAELATDIINENSYWQRELVKQVVEATEAHYGVQDKLKELAKWCRRERSVANKIGEIKAEIVSHVRGLKPEHVDADQSGNRYNRYDPPRSLAIATIPDPFTTTDFKNYPGLADDILQAHARSEFKRLAWEHPVGQRMHKLRLKAQEFRDRIVAAATHAQLQLTWKQLTEEFDMIMEETKDRQPRKVATARNETVKPAKASK